MFKEVRILEIGRENRKPLPPIKNFGIEFEKERQVGNFAILKFFILFEVYVNTPSRTP